MIVGGGRYIVAQPGIQRQVTALRDLTARIDAGLSKHLEQDGVEFIQFSFRWMNCLLMREISVKNTIRMWDTYLVRFPSPFPSLTQASSDIPHFYRPKNKASPSFISTSAPPFSSSGLIN